MKNLFCVKDRVVVITGATGVLGRSMVLHFAEEGARVVLIGRKEEVGHALERQAIEQGGDAMFLAADVLDREQLERTYEKIMERYGRIDVLINGAGGNMAGATIAPDKTIFDLSMEAFRGVVDLNLFGTVLPTMIFARAMVAQGGGSIINIASGFFLTEQNRTLLTNPDGSLTPRAETILAHTPFHRFGRPEELLGTLQWLASDASCFVSGTVTVIDGGFDAFSI